MIRVRIALVLTAAAVAYWITVDSRSFLYTFLCTIAATVLAVGIGLAIHGVTGTPTPTRTYTERDLREIEFNEYLDALDRVQDWGEK